MIRQLRPSDGHKCDLFLYSTSIASNLVKCSSDDGGELHSLKSSPDSTETMILVIIEWLSLHQNKPNKIGKSSLNLNLN